MNHIGQNELTEMMGIGNLGEIRRGPDGGLYQWVEGVDGLGNLAGWWSKLKKGVKSVAKKATQFVSKPWCIPLQAIPKPIKGIAKSVCKVVGKLSPLAHIPVVGSYYRGAAKLCQLAKGCGIAGLEVGLGDGTFALYQGVAEDDNLYGLVEEEVLYGLGQEDMTEIMGIGSLGDIRRGPDGEQYQWVEGIDGLGRRKQFWHCRHCLAIKNRLTRQRMPGNSKLHNLTTTPSQVSQPKPAVVNGLDDLYQTSDGRTYKMAGRGENDDTYGLAEGEEIDSIGQGDSFEGLAEYEELDRIGQDDDLYGLAQDEDLYGLEEDEDLNGYLYTQDGVHGLDAYVSDKPPGNRMFVRPAQTPEIWKSLW